MLLCYTDRKFHLLNIEIIEKIINLKNYERIEEAMLDQSVLKENEISSSINSANSDILPVLNELNEGISLMVFEKDMDNAWEILKDYHQQDE